MVPNIGSIICIRVCKVGIKEFLDEKILMNI
mgnify:CR=1 FL=1